MTTTYFLEVTQPVTPTPSALEGPAVHVMGLLLLDDFQGQAVVSLQGIRPFVWDRFNAPLVARLKGHGEVTGHLTASLFLKRSGAIGCERRQQKST